MKVRKARVLGFCGGVRRAVAMAEEAAGIWGRVQTDGPVVHNPDVVRSLERLGVAVRPELDESCPVLIRAHGAPPERLRACRERGLRVIDATCPFVSRNQESAARAAEAGALVLFAGDRDHAETRAVTASAGTDCRVVSSADEIMRLPDAGGRVFLLAQTTFGVSAFVDVRRAALSRWPGAEVMDSICHETVERQKAARELGGAVEIAVVIGGRESANTRRLAEVVREAGARAHLVENAGEVRAEWFAGTGETGITAGASTPDSIIKEVLEKLESL